MKNTSIEEVMVPVKDYVTVSEDDSMYEIVLALEQAQTDFNRDFAHHRAILVRNAQDKIVGKVSQLDLLKALEPKYSRMVDVDALSRTGYGMNYIESLAGFWRKPLDDICRKAAAVKVKEFMYTPDDGEYVRADAELNDAIHRLIAGKHQSLLVTRDDEIVGVLRLADVFKLVCERIKACSI